MTASRIIAVATPALFALGVAAWLLSGRADPAELGLVGPMTGAFSDAGIGGRNGAELAVEEVNRGGGVAGRPLRLVALDDRSSSAGAVAGLRAHRAAGRLVQVGPFTTQQADAVVEALGSGPGLVVGPTVAGADLAGRDDGFVKLFPSQVEVADALGAALADRGVRRLAVVFDRRNAAFAVGWADGMRARLGAGAVVAEVGFAGQEELGGAAASALAAAPDGILLVAGALDAGVLAQRIRPRFAGTLAGASWAHSAELVQAGGRAVEGMLFANAFDPDCPGPAWRAFAATYRARYGVGPDFFACYAYDAVAMLAAAARRCGSWEAGPLKTEVVGREHAGLQGAFRVDGSGDARRPLHRIEVRDGAFRRLDR